AAVGSGAERFFSERFVRVVEAHLDGNRGRLRALAASDDAGGPFGFRAAGTEFALDPQISRRETPNGGVCVPAVRDVTDGRRSDDEQAAQLEHAQAARSEAEQAAEGSRLLAEASRMLSLSLDYELTLGGLARLLAGTLADWCTVDVVDEQ